MPQQPIESQKSTPLAPVTPRPAATVVILRDGTAGLEAFMVVRHHEIDFASGALVFPGGKVDTPDGDSFWQDRAPKVGATPDHAFWIAAARETFEEAGLLLARRRGAEALLSQADTHRVIATHRPKLLKGETSFADIIRTEDLEIATDLMVHYAHWITPMGVPKRFDTHFLMVAAPADQIGAADGSESVDGLWISPAQAIADGDAGRRTLVPATRMNLKKITPFKTVTEAMSTTRAGKVVTVLPQVFRSPEGRTVKIPVEAGYGVSEYFVAAGQPTASGKA
jgi:8-oxo-dGTP pyrophosphatase MutT (NUDIX family)